MLTSCQSIRSHQNRSKSMKIDAANLALPIPATESHGEKVGRRPRASAAGKSPRASGRLRRQSSEEKVPKRNITRESSHARGPQRHNTKRMLPTESLQANAPKAKTLKRNIPSERSSTKYSKREILNEGPRRR